MELRIISSASISVLPSHVSIGSQSSVGHISQVLSVLCLVSSDVSSFHTPCLSLNLIWSHSLHTPRSAPLLCIGTCCSHYLSTIPSNVLWWAPWNPLQYPCLSWNSSPFLQSVLSTCFIFVSVVVVTVFADSTLPQSGCDLVMCWQATFLNLRSAPCR